MTLTAIILLVLALCDDGSCLFAKLGDMKN